MNGTTLCPHCDTRFKIVETQLEAHQGMVRCGHCLQAFDARPGFIPDQPSPQLELPILNEPAPPHKLADEPPAVLAALDEAAASSITTAPDADAFAHEAINMDDVVSNKSELDAARYGTLDYVEMAAAAQNGMPPGVPLPPETESSQPMTLAEQVAIVQDEDDSEYRPERRTWPWAMAVLLLLLVSIAQAAYFFRVDLAARLPGLKPALVSYCQLLKCTVPLPQNTDLMSIESSDLEADPSHENQITLNALLHNRAPYSQAFPHLELTLNDTQDKPLARRVFRPADYLPPVEKEQTGLLPNHELSVRLRLDTTDLKPSGYRLVLFYPQHNAVDLKHDTVSPENKNSLPNTFSGVEMEEATFTCKRQAEFEINDSRADFTNPYQAKYEVFNDAGQAALRVTNSVSFGARVGAYECTFIKTANGLKLLSFGALR